jgi:glycosyltransferase involved in cell wall biosynthesis
MKRAIFYSPMTGPDATAPSGAQRMCALLQQALTGAGFEVARPQLPCTYDGRGDSEVQAGRQAEGERATLAFLDAVWEQRVARPDLWFSYHVYYKAPDWIGPTVSHMLGIPYVVAEGSYAPKRAGGPWSLGHDGASAALGAADRLLAMTAFDRYCLDQIAPGRVRDLKPFIDVGAFLPNTVIPEATRALHVVTVAMMRNERKRASYALLAGAMRQLTDLRLTLTVAGDGRFRPEVEAMFAGLREVRFLGAVAADRVPALLAAGDIFAWPGLGEAYGLAFLEAQAMGLPVVACLDRGVPDATREGETTLLSAPDDPAAYAANLRRLASDRDLRARLGANGRKFVAEERSVAAAANTLRRALAEIGL